MSHNILREVGDNIKKAKWFSILADECRDIANKEQLTICLRWVDDDLEPHEIPNINADTIFSAIQDCLIRMDLSLQNCRGQCYDGAGSMMGIRNGLATKIQKKVTATHKTHCHGHKTHCHGHALNLAVKDTTKKV